MPTTRCLTFAAILRGAVRVGGMQVTAQSVGAVKILATGCTVENGLTQI